MSVDVTHPPLCRVEDLAEGKTLGCAIPGQRRKVIVMRHGGAVKGWLDACPHYQTGTPMAWKTNEYLNGAGTHLACSAHGALFDPDTGECVAGACLGKRLTPVALSLYADGTVRLAEERGGGTL